MINYQSPIQHIGTTREETAGFAAESESSEHLHILAKETT